VFIAQEVTWLVLPAAWRLDVQQEIITTVPREALAGVLNRPHAA
jgi:hypothetical protein